MPKPARRRGDIPKPRPERELAQAPQKANEDVRNYAEELKTAEEALRKKDNELEEKERKLHELTTELDSILNSADIPIIVVDESLGIRRFTRKAERVLAVPPEAVGRQLTTVSFPFTIPDLPVLVRKSFEDLTIHHLEIQDNSGRWYALWVHPYKDAQNILCGAVLTFIDIHERKQAAEALQAARDNLENRVRQRTTELESTGEALKAEMTERKRAEERLHQSQKMEAIGRLAGGVAHDFNNLLTIISGYAELALSRLAPDHPICADLKQIMSATGRATTLTNHLLAFSRRQPAQPKVLDLNQFISETEKILRRVIPEQIEIRCILNPEPVHVSFDQGQLEQVLMNLILNARDAMPNGGRITVETSRAQSNDDAFAPENGLSASDYVVFSVSDTGIGMSKEVYAHLFEPFFTTKPRGKGTGLGLSMVYGIVKRHGGEISIRSQPNQGTTVRIYLKRTAAEDKREPEESVIASDRGSETVLLVEDEPSLRDMTRHILEQQGYKVLDAGNGQEAMRVFEQNRDSVDVLLTDIVMPQMNGKELADRLQEQRPDLKIIFMSGYTNEFLTQHGIPAQADNLVQKPFTSQTLNTMLRKKLRRRSNA